MPIKILLIEDNLDHVVFTKRVLGKVKEEFLLEHTSQSREGLKKITECKFDVVLCDYRLPDASALDILKKARQLGQDVPFIIITSSGSEKIAVELMKEGAYDYIVKDGSYEAVLPVVIRGAMDRYSVKKEKERLEQELGVSNERLKEMYRIKSEFTSTISHELRTPLTAIKESIALILQGAAGQINGQQEEILAIAKNNVDRLARLINDVLDFAKLESKKINFKVQLGDMNEIIKETIDIQKAVAARKDIFIHAELDSKLPKIVFDADRISQVLSNLISNAIKFTAQGGITIVSAHDVKEENIKVIVKDTGEGIAHEDLPKLFHKFQQLGDIDRRKTGGTGLGLAISKEIIVQHEGSIWVESVYGEGSQFIFTLPVKEKRKVLVIDDERIVLDTFAEVLKKEEYTLLFCETGGEGLKVAQTVGPDLIVLDMKLKDIGGYEVIGRLKSNKDTAGIPILVISGYMDELEKIKAQEELALPYILKPFDTQAVVSKIKTLLGK